MKKPHADATRLIGFVFAFRLALSSTAILVNSITLSTTSHKNLPASGRYNW
jgi:hypothetical protein